MDPESALVEKGFVTDVAPNGDGVDEDVMLHPKMLVETDGFLLLREEEAGVGRADAAEILAGGRQQHVVTAFLVLGQQERRSVGIGRLERYRRRGRRRRRMVARMMKTTVDDVDDVAVELSGDGGLGREDGRRFRLSPGWSGGGGGESVVWSRRTILNPAWSVGKKSILMTRLLELNQFGVHFIEGVVNFMTRTTSEPILSAFLFNQLAILVNESRRISFLVPFHVSQHFDRFDVLGQRNDGQSIARIRIPGHMIELGMSDAEDAAVQIGEQVVHFPDV